MKKIKLTQGFVAQVDDEDFEYLSQWKWTAQKGRYTYYGYRTIGQRKGEIERRILLHRLIMNTPKGMDVDHIDHNGLNNQKSNLRNCSRSQNMYNCKPWGKSKYLGVGYAYNQIQCHISINGINKYLGSFKTEEDAARYYDKKAIEYYEEFANLNFK